MGLALAALVFASAGAGRLLAQDAAMLVQDKLYAGKLKEGETALAALVAQEPANADARFGLGVIRFARAIEHLGQSLYRYGLRAPGPREASMPIVRLPVPENPSPQALTYDSFRAVLQDLVDDLRNADATLADIGDAAVRLPLDPSKIRLDITGDGGAREEENLWFIFGGVAPGATAGAPADLGLVLDHADVDWLRGYCHLLMGFTERWLAHDFKDMFEDTFGLFFPRAGLRQTFAGAEDRERTGWTGFDIDIADFIALVHLIHWPMVEPDRMLAARAHLLEVVARSRASWKTILARTDRETHWIPGPGQKGVLQGLSVTPERVSAWLKVLDDADAILEGRKLVPHWRFVKGINLKRVFTEPQAFDLILWITGPGARPYLENGEMISAESWQAIDRAFGGNFASYAFWFN
jgi:hypothetical protein